MEIPTYESSLEYIDVEEPYRKVWRRNGIFRLFAHNATNTKRNYSMASNPESEKEIVYIGGGAGMAPLRSHISYLFESLKTKRQVSYWYGARSIKELFYTDYFEKLAEEYRNFRFYTALSEPQPGDKWDSYTGMIHQVARDVYLSKHKVPGEVEYYLCGPPAMVTACIEMLKSFKVPEKNISFDEF